MLKKSPKLPAIRSLVVILASAALFSFAAKVGVDSFTIYVNDKLMVQQYVTRDASVKNFTLADSETRDVLRIHYSHCGKTGMGRKIALYDGTHKAIKTWDFADEAEMHIGVGEVLSVSKKGHAKVNLVYSSQEIPGGKLLATILLSEARASLK